MKLKKKSGTTLALEAIQDMKAAAERLGDIAKILKRKKKETRWVVIVKDCVEPELAGPFDDQDHRNDSARKFWRTGGTKDAVFGLNIVDGVPHVFAWSTRFMEEGW